MKKICYIIFLIICVFAKSQSQQYWLIDQETNVRKIKKDSANAVLFLDSLSQNSYFFTEVRSVKQHDNRIEIVYDKGPNFNKVNVVFSDSLTRDLGFPKDLFTKNLDSLKKNINQKYRNKGFAFNRVKSRFVKMQNNIPQVELSVSLSKQRLINGFVFKNYERLPKRFVKNLEKNYVGKVYEDKNLIAINNELQGHPFVLLEKPPQTLFTKDSTQIYLFLQKKRTNLFDGMIGFGNDKTEKFNINGTLNVALKNMFNGFETVSIYWQRNPDSGQSFDLQADIPYLFKSNVGLNVNANIYRQDSTFANVKMMPSLYYHISDKQKIGFRGTFENSVVLDSLYSQGNDYSKKGFGVWYQYNKGSDIPLFLHKTNLRAEVDFLNTNYEKLNQKFTQIRYFATAEHNLHLRGNNYLNLKAESALLSAKNDLSVNELFRFGGWNSFRGFNEQSLISDFYAYAGLEYRYLVNNQAFFDAFVQYGNLTNKSINANLDLYSVGVGFNFFLPVGLMSFQISNGNQFGNPFKFAETKIHWGLVSKF